MIEIADIKDRDSLKQWLTDWPKENGLDEDAARAVAVTIAHRAAMRVLPVWWEDQNNDAKEVDLLTLSLLRCCLISQVAAKMPMQKARKAARFAVDLAVTNGHDSIFDAAEAAVEACQATFKPDFTEATADAVSSSSAATSFATSSTTYDIFVPSAATAPAFWSEIQMDCTGFAVRNEAASTPLWKGQKNPLESFWHNIKSLITAPEWSFWIKWYEDALAGTPPNWDMLEQIALIESEIWEAGPEAVSERIALITEKYELLSEVQAARISLAELRAEAKALAQRSHNNPPELVDTDMSVIRSVEIIWTELGQAEEELEKPDPSPSRLRRISAALLEACKTVAMYCAELGDIALKNAAKEVGSTGAKWTIRVLAVSYTAQNPGIQSLAARIYEFAGNLPNLP